MKTKGEVIRFKLELMAVMLVSGREALDICDTITEQMPEEAEE
jgi:hypothetical protein